MAATPPAVGVALRAPGGGTGTISVAAAVTAAAELAAAAPSALAMAGNTTLADATLAWGPAFC